MQDVPLQKASIIERCLRRVAEIYRGDPASLKDWDRQDAILLNLERACQAAIDLAMFTCAQDHLGVPTSSADAFLLLEKAGRIPLALGQALRAMVGFRNVAVHAYRELDLAIVQRVVETAHRDLAALCRALGLRID